MRADDELVPVDEMPAAAAASTFAGEADWPRTGRVASREPAGARSESFWIEDPSGVLGDARPGQHLRVHLADQDAPSWRSYTISATGRGRARITVRRDGRISGALHDGLAEGADIIVTGPFGDVTLDRADARDVVLVSAGSGVTPTVAMLRALAADHDQRRVRVLHVERTTDDLALWEEVTAACSSLPDARAALHLSRAVEGAAVHGARVGRPTAEDVLSTIADLDPGDVDVYVCGPALFTAEVRTVLHGAGVPAEHVHAEVFYSPTTAELTTPREPSSEGPHRITAGRRSFTWTAGAGSILDAVEGAGQDWPNGCRVGACGTCVRTLVSGDVEYLVDPIVPPAAGSVLVCCSAPVGDVEIDEP